MSLILDLLKALVLGVLAFYLFPLVAGLILPWDDARDLVRPYVGMATSTLKRALLVKRSHGGWTLKKTSFDGGVGGEVAKLSGEPHTWRDFGHHMTTWKSATFGLAHEDKNVIFDARVPDLGRRFRELQQTGRWLHDGRRKAFFLIDDARSLVNLDDALNIIPGSASPRLADRVEEDIKKSQALFNSRKGQLVTTLQLLMFFGAGVGTIYFASRLRGSGGGSVTSVTLLLQPLSAVTAATLPLVGRRPLTRTREWIGERVSMPTIVGFTIALAGLGLGATIGISLYATEILPSVCTTGVLDQTCTAAQTARTMASITATIGLLALIALLAANETHD
ncbi:hypothetical protein [Halarchaeum salinum]|uniref:Uncharacterized protein n=1 Tax=Halarchaeum salinum TaxID=489912 RepID=A0AAV3S9F2_9EURY